MCEHCYDDDDDDGLSGRKLTHDYQATKLIMMSYFVEEKANSSKTDTIANSEDMYGVCLSVAPAVGLPSSSFVI